MNAFDLMRQFEIAVTECDGDEMERISMMVMDGSEELQEEFFSLCGAPA